MNKQKLIELKELRKNRGVQDIIGDLIEILLEDDTPETPTTPKFFVPKVGEKYWYIHTLLGVVSTTNEEDDSDTIVISLGTYRTEEECTQAFEKQKALIRLWKNADEKYFFRPDWEDSDQTKYLPMYNNRNKTWGIEDCLIYQINFSIPHFATQKDAENFIKENEKDLEIYRNY